MPLNTLTSLITWVGHGFSEETLEARAEQIMQILEKHSDAEKAIKEIEETMAL